MATRKVRELSRSERYRHDYELLTSVPGIGISVAMALLTEIGDFNRFRNEREFASYLGLVPTSHSSGGKVAYGEKDVPWKQETRPADCGGFMDKHLQGQGLGCAYVNYKKTDGTTGGDY